MQKNFIHLIFFVLFLLIFIPLSGCLEEEQLPVTAVNSEPPVVNKPDEAVPEPVIVVEPEASHTTEPVSPVVQPPEPVGSSDSWYFKRNNQHQVPFVAENIQQRLQANNAFYYRESPASQIYLTFDEGYELGYTGQILDILKSNDVKAIFFITGHYIDSQPELVIRMKEEGHLVGNHTVNHPDLGIADLERITAEITGLEDKFTQLTGLPMDKYLRPPMGLYSDASLAATANLGYQTVFWSIAFADWDPHQQPGADYSYQHVMDNIHPGAVILLHAVSQSNTEALDRIIKDLKAAGYVFSVFP